MSYKEFNKKYYKKYYFKKHFNSIELFMIKLFKISSIFSKYYNNFFKVFFNLPKNAKVLDLGIADGTFTNFMYRLRPDLKYFGLDFTDVLELLPEYVTFYKRDATNFELKEKFDLVVSNHLIEHLKVSDVLKVFNNVYVNLKKNGIFWLTTPSLCEVFYDDPTHIRPYTKKAIKRLFFMSNFKQIKTYEGKIYSLFFNLIKTKFKKSLTISYGFAKK